MSFYGSEISEYQIFFATIGRYSWQHFFLIIMIVNDYSFQNNGRADFSFLDHPVLAFPFPGFNLWTVSLLIRSLRPEEITRTKSTSVHFAWLTAYFQSQKNDFGDESED